MSSLNNVRLPDGTDVVMSEWLDQPVFSTMEFAATSAPNLDCFNYVVGGPVSSVGLARRNATEADTNIVRPRSMNQDESMIVFGITPEFFALTNATVGSPPETVAFAPMLSGSDVRRLQTQLIFDLFVGDGIKKPMYQVPLEWLHQSIGAPGWCSGDFAAIDYGTAGVVSARDQERLKLPIYIGGYGQNAKPGNMMTFFVRVEAPNGAVVGLRQNVRIVWHLIGLKKRPA